MSTKHVLLLTLAFAAAVECHGATAGTVGEPWATLRETGDAECGVWAMDASAGRIAIAGSCSGLYLRELDASGNTLNESRRAWISNGNHSFEKVEHVVLLADDRAVVLGASSPNRYTAPTPRGCAMLIANGTILGEFASPITTIDACSFAGATADGGISVAGTATSGRIEISRLDASGTLRWQRVVGEAYTASSSYAVDVVGDDTWVAYYTWVAGTRERVVVRYDANGVVAWSTQTPVSEFAYLRGFEVAPGQAYLLETGGEDAPLSVAAVGDLVVDARTVPLPGWPGSELPTLRRVGDTVVVATGFFDMSDPGNFVEGITQVAFDATLVERWRRVDKTSGWIMDVALRGDGQTALVLGESPDSSRVLRTSSMGASLPDLVHPVAARQSARILWATDGDLLVGGADRDAQLGEVDLDVRRIAGVGTTKWQSGEGVQPLSRRPIGAVVLPNQGLVLASAEHRNQSVQGPGLARFDIDGQWLAQSIFPDSSYPWASAVLSGGRVVCFESRPYFQYVSSYSPLLQREWQDEVRGSLSPEFRQLTGVAGGGALLVLDSYETSQPVQQAMIGYDAAGTRRFFTPTEAVLPGRISSIATGEDGDARIAGRDFDEPARDYFARIDAAGHVVVTGYRPSADEKGWYGLGAVASDGGVLRISPDGRFERIEADGMQAWSVALASPMGTRVEHDYQGGGWHIPTDTQQATFTVTHASATGERSVATLSETTLGFEFEQWLVTTNGGLVVGGTTRGEAGCTLVAVGLDREARIAWQWRQPSPTAGCHELQGLHQDGSMLYLVGISPVPGEPRASVVHRITMALFADSFE